MGQVQMITMMNDCEHAPALNSLNSLTHLGLIAGEGKFPFLIAQAAKSIGIKVTAIGVQGITSPMLSDEVQSMYWIKFGQLGRLIEILHETGVREAVMAGRLKHNSIFQIGKIDMRGIKILAKVASRKADALLSAFTEELAREDIRIIDSTLLLKDCKPPAGNLTSNVPATPEILEDIKFGRPLAKQIAGLDIGQTIVVKQKSVVAVEAMEGTNGAITRAGEIAGPGCVVIKVSKPRQDLRFDVPVVGLTTIEKLIQAECAALAVPAGEALFFDREEACRLAEQHGICIYAWNESTEKN